MKNIFTVFILLYFSLHSYASAINRTYYLPKGHSCISGDSTNKPLSVVLLDFQAILASEEKVKLTWLTASEKDSDIFIIERSSDGIHFEDVAQLKGAQNSCHILQYNFTDSILSYSQAYYRLKQIDINGQVNYSKVVEAHSKSSTLVSKH